MSGSPSPLRCAAALMIVVAVAASACSGPDSGSGPVPIPKATSPRSVYVAVGASETLGFGASNPVHDRWPSVFDRLALPGDTRFVDLGIPGVTVAAAQTLEVPAAVGEKPAVATVWLNVNDLIEGVSPRTYGRELTALLTKLRRGGQTKVLVA